MWECHSQPVTAERCGDPLGGGGGGGVLRVQSQQELKELTSHLHTVSSRDVPCFTSNQGCGHCGFGLYVFLFTSSLSPVFFCNNALSHPHCKKRHTVEPPGGKSFLFERRFTGSHLQCQPFTMLLLLLPCMLPHNSSVSISRRECRH